MKILDIRLQNQQLLNPDRIILCYPYLSCCFFAHSSLR